MYSHGPCELFQLPPALYCPVLADKHCVCLYRLLWLGLGVGDLADVNSVLRNILLLPALVHVRRCNRQQRAVRAE